MNAMEAMHRSYAAQRMYAPGSYVSVNEILERRIPIDTRSKEWVWEDVTLMPGESFRVINYTNAGFRGIEAAIENSKGQRIYGISAGYFIAPFEAH